MREFIDRYEAVRDNLTKAAPQLQELLETLLKDQRILFLAASVRIKTLASALRKISKKGYANPWQEMTDIIGARILTYFRPDSARVEELIRANFEVRDMDSKNKADELAFNAFGYTSRHLVCSLPERFPDLRLKALIPEGMTVEFQIRSVLEHGWAEIEHEVVYKSGTAPSDVIRRRFAASAAAIELVEREFDALRDFESHLAADRSTMISRHLNARLDRAWFVAVLMHEYPDRDTWSPDPTKNVFFRSYELVLIDLLRTIGVLTVRDFRKRLRRRKVGRLVRQYAERRGLQEDQVSHLPIAMLATFGVAAPEAPRDIRLLADEHMRELLRW